ALALGMTVPGYDRTWLNRTWDTLPRADEVAAPSDHRVAGGGRGAGGAFAGVQLRHGRRVHLVHLFAEPGAARAAAVQRRREAGRGLHQLPVDGAARGALEA